jgi:hypothetical protein
MSCNVYKTSEGYGKLDLPSSAISSSLGKLGVTHPRIPVLTKRAKPYEDIQIIDV